MRKIPSSSLERYKISLEVNEKNLAKLQVTSEPSDPDIIKMRDNQAWLLTKLGRYKEALNIHEDILQLQRNKNGEDHPDTLIAKNNLACSLSNLGRYDDALGIRMEVYDKRNSKYNELLNAKGPKSKSTIKAKINLIRAKNNLACTYLSLGPTFYGYALDLCNEVLEECQEQVGINHPETIAAENNLACLLAGLQDSGWEKPLNLIKSVLRKREVLLGVNHPETIAALNNLTCIQAQLFIAGSQEGALKVAVTKFRDNILLKLRNQLGEVHPDTIIAMNNLSVVLAVLGQYEEALELQQKVLQNRKQYLGENHPNTFNAIKRLEATFDLMNDRAVELRKTERYEDALELQQKVLLSSKQFFGEKHPDTINAIEKLENTFALMNRRAVEFSRDERYEDALELQQKILEKRKVIFGDEHPNTVSAKKKQEATFILMNERAIELRKSERYEDALVLLQKAFQSSKQYLGEEHPNTVNTKIEIENTLVLMNNCAVNLKPYEKALELQQKVVENQIFIFGEEHPNTPVMKYNKLDLMKLQCNALINFKQYNKALELHEEILKAEPDNKFPSCPQIEEINMFDYFSKCQQSDIIEASPKKSFFVDAGPGTGKTHTLIQKLNYLVSHEHVNARGILVLCFTRTAIAEIKDRLRKLVINEEANGSLLNIDIRTFDSFASTLINEANYHLYDEESWVNISGDFIVREYGADTYTARIQAACDRIIEQPYGRRMVEGGNWEYFVVDEVQDLTGARGWFVLGIIKRCLDANCGVTVMGDACQGVYDFQNKYIDERYKLESEMFYKELFQLMYGKACFVQLTDNHRQSPELISLTGDFRNAILSFNLNTVARAVNTLKYSVKSIDMTCSCIVKLFIDIINKGGVIGFLMCSNNDTKKMSDNLLKRGIPHKIRVGKSNNVDSSEASVNKENNEENKVFPESRNYFAPWIADVFQKGKHISKETFLKKYKNSTGADGSIVWRHLQKLLNTDDNSLDVRAVLNKIVVSDINDPFLRIARCKNIIVSNIHQSKGREYKCVVIDKNLVDDLTVVKRDSELEDYRLLYVAATRAEKHIFLADLKNPEGNTTTERWIKVVNGELSYFEFNGLNDIDCSVFAGISPKIIANINVGDAIVLKRLSCPDGEYQVIHEASGNLICWLTKQDNFIKELYQHLINLGVKTIYECPAIFRNLYISGIYSQVVDKQYLDNNPEIREKASNGVWKWIEIIGVGHAEYERRNACPF